MQSPADQNQSQQTIQGRFGYVSRLKKVNLRIQTGLAGSVDEQGNRVHLGEVGTRAAAD